MFEALAEISEALSDNLDINPEKADSVLDKFNDSFEESDDDSDEVPDEIQDSNEGPATDNDMILDKINDGFDLDNEVGEFDESESDSESDHYESVLDRINSDSLENETESNLTDLSDSSENKEKTDQSEQNEAQTDNQNKDSDENTEQRTDDAESSPIRIKCRNENLEGQEHPDTGVPFERKQIEVDGKKYEVVVPKFDSMFDAQLPEDMYKASDREQFNECNAQLKNEIATNPDLREKFDDEQLEQIENGDTPDGYTWHHDAEAGKMQLVDTETHQKTGHTGGRSIWGGGAESR